MLKKISSWLTIIFLTGFLYYFRSVIVVFPAPVYAQTACKQVGQSCSTLVRSSSCCPGLVCRASRCVQLPTAAASGSITPPADPDCQKKAQGDANCDGMINRIDYTHWKLGFSGIGSSSVDFNGDGRVDLVDFEVWRANSARETGPSPTASTLPGPSAGLSPSPAGCRQRGENCSSLNRCCSGYTCQSVRSSWICL